MSHDAGLGQPHGALAVELGFYISFLTNPCMWAAWEGAVTLKVKVAQLCPALCHPTGCRVHGILQARALEWVAFPFSRGASQPTDQTQVSYIAGRFFTSWAPRAAGQGKFFHFKQPLNIWVSSSPSRVSTEAAGYRSLGRMTRGIATTWYLGPGSSSQAPSLFFSQRIPPLSWLSCRSWGKGCEVLLRHLLSAPGALCICWWCVHRGTLSHLLVSSCLWLCGLQPSRLLCPWNFQGRNTGVGWVSSSGGSSQPRGRACISCVGSWVLYHWADRACISCVGSWVLYHWAAWEGLLISVAAGTSSIHPHSLGLALWLPRWPATHFTWPL